jgi:hypothetical protein
MFAELPTFVHAGHEENAALSSSAAKALVAQYIKKPGFNNSGYFFRKLFSSLAVLLKNLIMHS